MEIRRHFCNYVYKCIRLYLHIMNSEIHHKAPTKIFPNSFRGFSFPVFQNNVLKSAPEIATFGSQQKSIEISRLPSKHTDLLSAGFFPGLQRPGSCGHSRVDSAEDLLRDDVVPRPWVSCDGGSVSRCGYRLSIG